MKRTLIAVLVCVWIVPTLMADKPTKSTALFNGKDLTGWQGREDLWAVKDGAIVGTTTDDKPIKANTFLIWKDGTPADFELTLQFKIEGGNSGIQYRSTIKDEKEFIVGGYQADIDSTNKFAGILYEEKGRGILCQRGQSTTVNAEGKKIAKRFADSDALAKGIHPGKWNDYRIVAKGNKLQHFINGAMTAEVIDQQTEKAATSGVIAFQLHRGPAMVVSFKNITLHTFGK